MTRKSNAVCDLYDKTTNTLYEAMVARHAIRMVIGQLPDYARPPLGALGVGHPAHR